MKKLNLKIFPKIPKLDGLKLAYGCAGIKSKTKLDISIIVFEDFAYVASVLTKSKTCAANIIWLKKINKFGKVKVLFVNSGNANAYTGKEGYNNLLKIVNYFVKNKLCKKSEIIISSTGVIGEQLPIKKILNYLPTLIENKKLKPVTHTAQWKCFANTILTTDTFIKGSYLESKIGNKKVKIIGISKGSGMIAPNMATMLGYLFTDALLSPNILKRLLIDVCEKTFNSITVDGDTSTNDMVSFISTRKIACQVKSINDDKLKQFKMDLNKVALQLAKKIILDGEGAKKLIQVSVFNAFNYKEAKKVAMSIANSPLVKTAVAGEDANWGRIIMAIGKTNAKINQKKISLKFGDIMVIKNGEMQTNYKEANLSKYLKKKEIEINVNLSVGKAMSTIWTCDLTKEYISINADYRS